MYRSVYSYVHVYDCIYSILFRAHKLNSVEFDRFCF